MPDPMFGAVVRYGGSDDPVLVCVECGTVMCTIEAGDELGTLNSVADEHAGEHVLQRIRNGFLGLSRPDDELGALSRMACE